MLNAPNPQIERLKAVSIKTKDKNTWFRPIRHLRLVGVRVRAAAEPALSHEHDAARWAQLEEAYEEAVWPGYRESIARIRDHLLDPARAAWFELALDGSRVGG